jgi:RNA polymerase sigma-70 factor (ECF subfamily)
VFHSEYRKRKKEVEDADGIYAGKLRTQPDQQAHLDFEDLRVALSKLTLEQREALLLVTAQGLSYEAAAQICGVATGTIKSRVNRARNRLVEVMGLGSDAEIGPDSVTKAALAAD